MILRQMRMHWIKKCYPRVSGGDPVHAVDVDVSIQLSPRERG